MNRSFIPLRLHGFFAVLGLLDSGRTEASGGPVVKYIERLESRGKGSSAEHLARSTITYQWFDELQHERPVRRQPACKAGRIAAGGHNQQCMSQNK